MSSLAKRRIGLLGGSFNPAHDGHVHISLEAMRSLKLDEIWWLVSPQNPLKSRSDMASFEVRFRYAHTIAAPYRRIKVSDYETYHGLHYTVDTVAALQQHYRHTQFYWIMGADNLKQFHRWRQWLKLSQQVPIVIMDRAPFSHASLRSKAAIRLSKHRISLRCLSAYPYSRTPAWAYGFVRRHPQSATALRLALGKNAFLRDN